MRVFHLSTWQEKCGIATYAENLVRGLAELGVDSEVHPLNKRLKKYSTPSQVKQDLKEFCAKAKDFDLVHVQHEFGLFADCRNSQASSVENFHYLLESLSAIGQPTAVTFHTEPEGSRPLWRICTARGGRRAMLRKYLETRRWQTKISPLFRRPATRFQAIAHSRKSTLALKNSGFADANINTVPHGLVMRDRSVLATDSAVAKERLGYPKDCVLLSLFGFVAAYKGPDLAVQALHELPRQYQLAIVGGPHPEAAQDLTLNEVLALAAETPDLKERVRVTGFVPTEMLDLYHAATDVCLAPYRNVNLSASGALTWALSSGKPVIASKIPAFTEVNDQADCLLMVTEEAPYELAWQIQRLVGDPAYQKVLVANALKYVEDNSWPRVCTLVVDMYNQLLASDSRTKGVKNRNRVPSQGEAEAGRGPKLRLFGSRRAA